jgi:hypothetical protein
MFLHQGLPPSLYGEPDLTGEGESLSISLSG